MPKRITFKRHFIFAKKIIHGDTLLVVITKVKKFTYLLLFKGQAEKEVILNETTMD